MTTVMKWALDVLPLIKWVPTRDTIVLNLQASRELIPHISPYFKNTQNHMASVEDDIPTYLLQREATRKKGKICPHQTSKCIRRSSSTLHPSPGSCVSTVERVLCRTSFAKLGLYSNHP